MIKKFIVALLLCFTISALAHVEYGFDAVYRSYPLSASLMAKLGYGLRLWGSEAGESPLYGYIKPEIRYVSAGTYNSGSIRLKIFPISVLGVTAGAEAIANHDRYRAYDCVTYNCQGKFTQTFIEGTVALGWRAWFLLSKAGIEDMKQGRGQGLDFIIPAYGLVARADGDRLKYVVGVTGLKLNDSWTLAYSYIWAGMQEIAGQSQAHLGLINYHLGEFKIAVGGGVFHSEIKDKEATAVVRLQWAPTDSVELF